MALTKDQIIQAAEDIQATGENPTMEKIRTALDCIRWWFLFSYIPSSTAMEAV